MWKNDNLIFDKIKIRYDILTDFRVPYWIFQWFFWVYQSQKNGENSNEQMQVIHSAVKSVFYLEFGVKLGMSPQSWLFYTQKKLQLIPIWWEIRRVITFLFYVVFSW